MTIKIIYYDQIYFALAEIALKEDERLQGIEYFNASNVQVGVDDDPAGTFLVELDSGPTGSSFYGIITAKQTVEGNPLEVNQALPKQIKQKVQFIVRFAINDLKI